MSGHLVGLSLRELGALRTIATVGGKESLRLLAASLGLPLPQTRALVARLWEKELVEIDGDVLRLDERVRSEIAAACEVASLSGHELAVAGRVAAGMSNAEVAADLYVTVKAVEWHLTSVYRKLGVRSRRELAARYPIKGT